MRDSTSTSVTGVAHGAPSSSISVLATLDTGPSKTLLLQSRQIPVCPNTTNICLSSNMPSKLKTKHIHVVFVLIAETLSIFFSSRKIYGKKLKFYCGYVFFSSFLPFSNQDGECMNNASCIKYPTRGITSEISTSNVQRKALKP